MTYDYEFLTTDNIAKYLRADEKLSGLINADNLTSIREIGDGNLNLVFHVEDASGQSLILKQSLPYVRMTGDGWPMTPERAAREAYSLQQHGNLRPELVVGVVQYDPERFIMVLEDLSDHTVWRDALNESITHRGVAAKLGEYVANVAVGTSILGVDRTEIAGQIADTQNPDLCVITEDLVFTEPVFDIGRNAVLPENERDAAELASDPLFAEAMAEAKWRFMTQAEALIHGDLHSGSVMVRGEDDRDAASVKVFDSEFAFYGPIAFDLGALFANYGFAAARASALGETQRAGWAISLIRETWEAFETEYLRLAGQWHETQLFNETFARRRLARILQEAALFGAAKMARRIVGAAKVRDIETLEPELRAPAARAVLQAARSLAATWQQIESISQIEEQISSGVLSQR